MLLLPEVFTFKNFGPGRAILNSKEQVSSGGIADLMEARISRDLLRGGYQGDKRTDNSIFLFLMQ